MIVPINGHVIVEPVVHDSFVAVGQETYDEVGIVIKVYDCDKGYEPPFNVGDKVWFDSWLAAKYPKNANEHFWLVKYDDIRAYEKISE